jgi:hypothetical protein
MQQKRILAQNLIQITLHAFRLRAEDRYRVSVEFVSSSRLRLVNPSRPLTSSNTDCTLEVMGHDMSEEIKRAFTQQARALLARLLPPKEDLFLRALRIKPDSSLQIAIQFGELNPAVSEPFVVHPHSHAA